MKNATQFAACSKASSLAIYFLARSDSAMSGLRLMVSERRSPPGQDALGRISS